MAFYDSWIARPGERVGYLDHAEDGPSVEGVDGALGVTFVVSYFYARISHAFRRRVRNTDLHYGCLFFFSGMGYGFGNRGCSFLSFLQKSMVMIRVRHLANVMILGRRNVTMTTSIGYDCYRYSVCDRVDIVQSEIPRISNE